MLPLWCCCLPIADRVAGVDPKSFAHRGSACWLAPRRQRRSGDGARRSLQLPLLLHGLLRRLVLAILGVAVDAGPDDDTVSLACALEAYDRHWLRCLYLSAGRSVAACSVARGLSHFLAMSFHGGERRFHLRSHGHQSACCAYRLHFLDQATS